MTDFPEIEIKNPPKLPCVCQHKNTHYEPWPDGGDVEVCDDCGMSRHHWEQGKSEWKKVDVAVERWALAALMP